MGFSEEPRYRRFEGTCRKCGKKFTYHNSVEMHKRFQECRECEEARIVETLTGEKTFDSVVKGWG